MNYQRIMVAGCSGCGKSTLGRTLAERSGLPLIHLDQEYWKPGWIEPDRAAWREKVASLASGEEWIMDGNYSGTWGLRLPKAQLLIYLRYPLWLMLYRGAKRVFTQLGRVRPDMAPGCPEQLSISFFFFIVQCYFRRKRAHITPLMALTGTPEVHIFRHPRELDQWLETHFP